MTALSARTRAPLLALILLLAWCGAAAAQTKLLRFPAISGDRIVFTYAGDLWSTPVAGGTAVRLTAHPGVELFAKFSPDGHSLAFTGQYDGDEQVYVMPASGGVPKQLTYYPARGPLAERWGYDHQVYGWSPDGTRVLFRSGRDSWALPIAKLYTVSAAGGPAEPLPMPTAGSGAFDATGNRIVYSPTFRDFRSEKRYSGGQRNKLVIFDLAEQTALKLPEQQRAQRDAMWLDGLVYYNSDEDGTFNLYAYDPATGQARQVTRGTTWDVRWPSADPATGRIVYELGGELHVLDTRAGTTTPVRVHVPTDGLAMRPARTPAAGNIEGFALSPKGERALFVGRGDVFTAPIEKGATRNLTRSSSAHDKHARWSPDGSKIAFISDRTGEEEVWLIAQDGTGSPEQLTRDGSVMRYAPEWSADGSRLAFADKDGKLWVLTLADRRLVEVADHPRGQISNYEWSPAGLFLAFTLDDARGISAVHIYDADRGRLHRVTDGFFDEYGATWDPEGKFLYYLSQREFAPQLSNNEWNFAGNRSTRIYALALRADVEHPFPVESDEVKVGTDAAEATSPPMKPARAASTPLRIDFDGISRRVAPLPLEADNYFGLAATKGHLFYMVGGAGYYGRTSERRTALKVYELADRKETVLVEDANGYALSQDGTKVLVREGGAYHLYDAKPGAAGSKKVVSTAGLYVDRVPAEEWTQIFDEVWRRYRDWFYVPNMHGNDWQALREQYRPLLQHVAHRSDLNYLISEMIAELSVQHAYIAGGDWDLPARPRVALPGARFELDRASGRYRISRIFAGHNEEPQYRAPLTELGVDARVGEYVLAIDGTELRTDEDPYRLLQHKADRPVTLTLARNADGQDRREVTFRPVTSESDLVYLDWVLGNRQRVSELSAGRVGYIHIPDMGAAGLREFIKWYYPQIRMEGLVVDARANGGGNVSSMLIERLSRVPLAAGFSRTDDYPTLYPRQPIFYGSMAALLDENSASDGDIFPAMFRQAKLGPLIGVRSWGGVVGITNRGDLIDGGVVNVPEFGFNAVTGEWIIEGYGVDPDIVVEQDPAAVIAGRDPQLERAVQEVLRGIEQNPKRLPARPAPPVKTKAGTGAPAGD